MASDKHDWKCIEVGNWYSEYQCTKCKERTVEEPDGAYRKPERGCKGSRELANDGEQPTAEEK